MSFFKGIQEQILNSNMDTWILLSTVVILLQKLGRFFFVLKVFFLRKTCDYCSPTDIKVCLLFSKFTALTLDFILLEIMLYLEAYETRNIYFFSDFNWNFLKDWALVVSWTYLFVYFGCFLAL